mmetsp:Transcript_25708/g.73441  ORF Transcript_25708/g.73441 Transcript_25708/m.73441 type:complete len:556 (+) Transcript_25708:2592-4259(+)
MVELVGIIDHVRAWHEVLVGQSHLGHAFAHEVLLRERGHRHCPLDDVLPEGVRVNGAREAARQAHDRDLRRALPGGLGQGATAPLAPARGAAGLALAVEKIQQCPQRGVGVDVEDGDRDPIALRQLVCDPGSQHGVPAEVEEVLLEVQGLQAQVQGLGPHALHDAPDALLQGDVAFLVALLRRLLGCLGRQQRGEVVHLRHLLAVQLPGLAAAHGGRHLLEERRHKHGGQLPRDLLLHLQHELAEVVTLVPLQEAQEAVHGRWRLVERDHRALGHAVHLHDGALHHCHAHLEAADLDRTVHAAAYLQGGRAAHEPPEVARLVPLGVRARLLYLGIRSAHESLGRHAWVAVVAAGDLDAANVELAGHSHRAYLLCLGVEDGDAGGGGRLASCGEDLARLEGRLGRHGGVADVASFPGGVVVDELDMRQQLAENAHRLHGQHLPAREPHAHAREAVVDVVRAVLHDAGEEGWRREHAAAPVLLQRGNEQARVEHGAVGDQQGRVAEHEWRHHLPHKHHVEALAPVIFCIWDVHVLGDGADVHKDVSACDGLRLPGGA